MIKKYEKYHFLFSVLVKRDFNKKYNRTVLGALWSLLSPLLMVLTQSIVFTHFFGRTTPHFVVYMFIGNIVYSFFRQATTDGMMAIESNAGIISKIRVPKYLFVFSKNVVSVINMLLTLILLFTFCFADGMAFSWKWIMVAYPLLCLTVFNIGAGLLLSGVYVFFRDTRYFYDIFCVILMYFSAIFYTISSFPEHIQWLFNINPVFAYISYIRKLLIYSQLPSLRHTMLCLGYAAIMLGAGCLMYFKKNRSYIYQL
ncbi:MAG: ABC transporter permease [Clostridiales bacterium]|jgi:ABC-2 type transport system permease protein|nr:ABC transporter permease [Clostridiales bacterium]